MRGACPRTKCDFFVPKYRKKYFKIKKSTREDKLFDALNDILRRLEAMEKKDR